MGEQIKVGDKVRDSAFMQYRMRSLVDRIAGSPESCFAKS